MAGQATICGSGEPASELLGLPAELPEELAGSVRTLVGQLTAWLEEEGY